MENKFDLYTKAKEAYYNGEEIMSDYEFDELEVSLGLENNSYIGTRHNPSYTEKHPFIMGSLSKVQIKEDKNGNIDWTKYYNDVLTYIEKASKTHEVIISPKYDGCSFECVVYNGRIQSISSRGDGEYGKDLKKHLINKIDTTISCLNKYPDLLYTKYVIRGEVLINKKTFYEKYIDSFVNPRSFVSGVLGSDYVNEDSFIEKLNDLDLVIYYIRYLNKNGWNDVDFDNYKYDNCPKFFKKIIINNSKDLSNIYNIFSEYRKKCEFALDGFVIKPISKYRLNNNKVRPDDCVAIKFIPMLEETVVEDIVWSTGKTNEYIPVVKVRPVIMDGKQISKASGHNYGYLIDKKISIGTKLILSLAGDIIPFIYKVTDTSEFSESKLNIPDGNHNIDGCHLYKVLSKEEVTYKRFINSVSALNIPRFGQANAIKLFEYLKNEYKGDEFFGIEEREIPDNILLVNSVDIERGIGGKIGHKIKNEFEKILLNITIKDIIKSLSIEDCGNKIVEQIENYFLNKETDFSHLNRTAYSWIFDQTNDNYIRMFKVIKFLNKNIDDFKQIYDDKKENIIEQIPVILTGEPNDYNSKGEFLKCHPEYRLTGSWKECKIVFTNSLESNTGKMKKAKEKNIEIRLY